MSRDDLFRMEEKFWTGDAEFYRRNLDDKCLVVFTEMAGLMDKEQIAGTIKNPNRWRKLDLKDRNFLPLADDVAVLSYKASAVRDNGEAYEALVSTIYKRRNGGWKMAFHQQTPLGGK
ncbi:MAG TPA: nuclear transport factor 2 family protein [Aestuariivirgaceae bacterium]|jgi:hypothetical protein